MSKQDKFTGLTVEIDTREKDKARINRLWTHFENMGATVAKRTLNDFDYHVYGMYREMYLDLGIEYKTINDLCSTWTELPERFGRAIQHVDELALFIEGNIETSRHQTDARLYVKNSTIDGTGETMPYAAFMSKFFQWSMSDVYVWNFGSVTEFPYSVEGLIDHIAGMPHTLIDLPKKDVRRSRFAFYQQIPGIGPKTALDLSVHPLMYWLEHVELLREIAKPSKTRKILEFVRGAPYAGDCG